jgi:hypothetical protein
VFHGCDIPALVSATTVVGNTLVVDGIAVDVTLLVLLMGTVVVSGLSVEVIFPVVLTGNVDSLPAVDDISTVVLIGNAVVPSCAVEVISPVVLIGPVVCGLVVEVTSPVVLIRTVVPRLAVVVAATDVTGTVGVLSGVLVTTVDSSSAINEERSFCKKICNGYCSICLNIYSTCGHPTKRLSIRYSTLCSKVTCLSTA